MSSISMVDGSAHTPCTTILDLSEHLLNEILEYVVLTDRRRILGSCSTLWKHRHNIENKLKHLKIHSKNELLGALLTRHLLMDRYGPVLSNLNSLVNLDVGPHGTDGLLYLLPTSACSNSLKSLSMVGSENVTDAGLMFMARKRPAMTDIQSRGILSDGSFQAVRAAMVERPPHRSSPLVSLAYIDLTFCRKTTYEGTMWLRDGLPNLKCIRRLPSWMSGRFHTPFAPDHGVEIHTYWPDGTFSFTRNGQSNGFVIDLVPFGKEARNEDDDGDDYDSVDFVGDKLQYNDTNFGGNVPPIVQYAYRPGVSLMRLPSEQWANASKPCVLVAQHLRGLRRPSEKEWMEQVAGQNIPIGRSKYYSRRRSEVAIAGTSTESGELVETNEPDENEENIDEDENTRETRPVVMMTKMEVEPFHDATIDSILEGGSAESHHENLLPPDSLVDDCRKTCGQLHQYDSRMLEEVERELDNILQGSW